MTTDTKIQDIINHECPSNDISVALLKNQLTSAAAKSLSPEATDQDFAKVDRIRAQYQQAKHFLCHA